jgi:polysaccharide chain length determinant protein (PEP-CTERM system associated)
MNELYTQFLFIQNAIWQRRFHALTVAWLVCIAGWIVVVIKPNTYTSSVRIFVDTSNILRPLLKGLAVETDMGSELELLKQTLTNRPNMERVVRMTDMDITAITQVQMEGLLDSLKSRTSVQTEGDHLLSIKFTDTNPVRARDVVQALTTVFIESNLGQNRKDMDNAREFIDVQIQNYERDLQLAEQRLATFQQETLSALPSDANSYARLAALRSDLVDAEAALQSSLGRRAALRQELETSRVSGAATTLTQLEGNLAEMLLQYTEQHPEVLALRRRIELTKETAESGGPIPMAAGTEGSEAADGNVVSKETHERIKIELAKEESDVAYSSGRVKRVRARLDELESLLAQVPTAEAELSKLNRDYEVLRGKHAELVSRREQARISRDRESRAEQIDFRIVDPPRVSSRPNGPSRPILLSVVLVLSVGIGVAFAFVLVYVNQTVSEPAQLKEIFALPVFGTVTPVETTGRHTWEMTKSTAFVSLSSLLLAAYGALLFLEKNVGLADILPFDSVFSFVLTAAQQGPRG